MASRENQSYLIAVICLVLLSLVLALVAFWGISKMNEFADNRDAAEAKLAANEKLLQANNIRSDVLKSLVGVGDSALSEVPTQIDMLQNIPNQVSDAGIKKSLQDIHTEVAAIKATYEKAVKSGVGNEGEVITFLSAIDNLNASLAKMNVEYRVKENQSVSAEQEAQRKIKEMEALVKKAEDEKQTAQADLQKEKDARRADQEAHQLAMNQASEAQRKSNDLFEKVRGGLEDQVKNLTEKEATLTESNATLTAQKNELTREVFDRADGQIVKVFSDSNLVYIDIGRAQGLTPNHTFSIYDQSVTNFEKGKEKGSIEITRVMDNQSEARVTNEDPTVPILPGDLVLTPTWDPGQRVRFAMAGFFDLDGDGFSDMPQLKSMMERNGAEVVCWHDEGGEVFGKIDPTIRFLVLGTLVQDGINVNPAIIAAMKKLKSEAEANTIQIIDQQKLLQRMGVRAQGKLEVIDRRVREGAFQSRTVPSLEDEGGNEEGGDGGE
jgi:hypothetical protein